MSCCVQLSTPNQNPQSCRDQTLCNSPFLLPSNLIHAENSTTWRRDRRMEEKEKKQPLKKNLKWEKERKLSIMKSGIVMMMMMMCCCAAAGYLRCHTAMTCSALPRHVCQLLHCLGLHTLPLERITELCSEKNQNIKRSYRPVCPMQSGQRWKIIPRTKTTEVLLLSLLWTEIWEAGRNAWALGHGWAQSRSQCGDRSVQLVLIPVHAYNCFPYFQVSLFPGDL